MFDTCSEKELEAAIEAMLFVSEEPVSLLSLADVLQCEPSRVKSACSELQQRLVMEDRGIQLSETAGGFRLVTHPRYHELIERYVVSWDTRKLTQAALETLAIVAYCQPITRNGMICDICSATFMANCFFDNCSLPIKAEELNSPSP